MTTRQDALSRRYGQRRRDLRPGFLTLPACSAPPSGRATRCRGWSSSCLT